jgi:hypothetical protein
MIKASCSGRLSGGRYGSTPAGQIPAWLARETTGIRTHVTGASKHHDPPPLLALSGKLANHVLDKADDVIDTKAKDDEN